MLSSNWHLQAATQIVRDRVMQGGGGGAERVLERPLESMTGPGPPKSAMPCVLLEAKALFEGEGSNRTACRVELMGGMQKLVVGTAVHHLHDQGPRMSQSDVVSLAVETTGLLLGTEIKLP